MNTYLISALIIVLLVVAILLIRYAYMPGRGKCVGSGDYPKEEFQAFQGEWKGRPIFLCVNQAYASYSDKATYPWCLMISVPFQNPNGNGMPTIEDNKKVSAFF